MLFYDANTLAPVARAQFSLAKNTTTVVKLGIECHTNYKLSCLPIVNIVVSARLLGDLTWVDIETTPIDLTPYNGLIKIFEFRFVVGAITSNERVVSGFRVKI